MTNNKLQRQIWDWGKKATEQYKTVALNRLIPILN